MCKVLGLIPSGGGRGVEKKDNLLVSPSGLSDIVVFSSGRPFGSLLNYPRVFTQEYNQRNLFSSLLHSFILPPHLGHPWA
jgi:hypothetical protein